MRADQKENFEKIANKIVFSMLESDGILKDRMHDRFDILGFLDPNGAKFLSMYIKKRTREFFSKEPYSKKAIFEAVTSLKAINSVRKSHNFHSVKHFEDIMLVEGASKSVAEVLALLRKKINQHLSFAQFYFEDPFQTLIDLEKEIEKLEDFSKLEKYNWIVAAFESDLRDYFNKTAPAILLEKIIQSYAQTTSSDHSCDRLVDMKERCEKFYATLSSEAEKGLAGLLFEIALFKSAIAQFHLETNSKTAADIAKKRVYAKNTSSFYEKNSASVLFKLEQESSMFRASFEANIAKLRTPDEVLKFIANIEDILNDERLTNSDKKDLLQTLFEEMTIEDPRLLRIFKAYRILGSDGNLNAELFPKQEKRLGLCS